jgi:type II secretory pathway component PulF
MSTYAYTAMDPAGRKRSGVVEAATERAAIDKITSEGRFVVEIEEQKRGADKAASHAPTERKKRSANQADVALFIRRMADLSGAGLPLDRVLQVLAEQSEAQPLTDAAEAALEDVKGGLPVSDALAKHPKMFPLVITQTLAAGEAAGQFSQSAERLAELQENEVSRRSQVISALIYPAVLLFTAILVVIFLLTFVVPRLGGVFADMGSDLPLPTQILLATTDFLTKNGLLLVGLIVGGVILFRIWATSHSGRYAKDALLLKMPIFGKIMMLATVSRYSRVLSTLVYGGVGILESLELAGLASGNQVFIDRNSSVQEDVRDGKPVADAMRDTGVFPPVLTHMAAIGEETGDLPKMLTRVSDSLDFEVEQGLRRATAMLEPIIVLAMGVFVAFVVLSVMLPIFQAQSLIK